MGESDWLAERFEENRSHLRAVAYRMLGSLSEAEDAVQEAWLRLSRSDTRDVENLRGWLTTVVARLCLDTLRSRQSRREEPLDAPGSDSIASREEGIDPEHEALLADSVGLALLVVLERLAPAERVAFVLHDMFDLSFDEIAPIVGRSPTAARQLASRARRRVRGQEPGTRAKRGCDPLTRSAGTRRAPGGPEPGADRARQRAVVDAFLAASRQGDFDALLAVLDPDVVLRADGAAVRIGASEELRGAPGVAGFFKGRARAAQPALLNGAAGAVWAPGSKPRVVFDFTIARGKIAAIDLIADPERLSGIDLVILNE